MSSSNAAQRRGADTWPGWTIIIFAAICMALGFLVMGTALHDKDSPNPWIVSLFLLAVGAILVPSGVYIMRNAHAHDRLASVETQIHALRDETIGAGAMYDNLAHLVINLTNALTERGVIGEESGLALPTEALLTAMYEAGRQSAVADSSGTEDSENETGSEDTDNG